MRNVLPATYVNDCARFGQPHLPAERFAAEGALTTVGEIYFRRQLLANADMMLPRGTLERGDGIGQPLIGVISAAAHRPAATLSNVKGKREAPSLPANVTCSHSSQTNLSEPAMWVSGIPTLRHAEHATDKARNCGSQ
jgi:hypothetical protein